MDLIALKRQLTIHEGKESKPYKDSVGKMSIGVGRNLDDKGLREDEIDLMLENDIKEVIQLLDKYLPWWRNLCEIRKRVLVDMGFNLGVGPSIEEPTGKLLTFKNTLKAMQEGRYVDAVIGMSESLWHRQVGIRALRLECMMLRGE